MSKNISVSIMIKNVLGCFEFDKFAYQESEDNDQCLTELCDEFVKVNQGNEI